MKIITSRYLYFWVNHFGLRSSIFAILSLLLSSNAISQTYQTYNLQQLKNKQDLRPFLSVIEDKTSNLSYEEIKLRTADFIPLQSVSPKADFGYTTSAMWFCLEIENTEPLEKGFVLFIDNPMLGKIELYWEIDGATSYHVSGREVKFSQRENWQNNPLFKLRLPENSKKLVYIRATSRHPLNMPLMIYTSVHHYQEQYSQRMVEGIIWGITLALFFYNLFLYSVGKDISYLYLLAYIVSMSGINITTTGFSSYLMPECYACSGRLNFISGTLVIISLGLQIDNFLNLKQELPAAHRIMVWTNIYTFFVTMPLALLWNQFWYSIMIIPSGLSMMISVSYLSVKMAMAGNRSAQIYLISMIAPAISGGVWMLYSAGLISAPPLLNVFQTSATAMQLVLLSMGVAHKINQIRAQTIETEKDIFAQQQQARLKSEFLAQMSHEIRTPINGILGVANIFGETKMTELQESINDMIYRSGQRLLSTINNILDFSKLEAERMVLHVDQVDVHQLLNEVVMLFSGAVETRKIHIILKIDKKIPRRLMTDGNALQQILHNLLDNAIAATQEGEITVEASQISHREADPGFGICFAVVDTGRGFKSAFADEALETLLEKIERIELQDVNTGLGLPIVDRYVKLLGGQCNISSVPGKGTKVTVNLIAERGTEPEIISYGGVARSIQEVHILVAEDNSVNQLVAKGILRSLGCQFSFVENGQRAVDAYKEKYNEYDLIFMDCEMPVLDGFQATQLIRQFEEQETLARVPIIALTAHSEGDIQEQLMMSGMDDILHKPLQLLSIKNMLKSFLNVSDGV